MQNAVAVWTRGCSGMAVRAADPKEAARTAIRAEHPAPPVVIKGVDDMRRGPKKRHSSLRRIELKRRAGCF